VAKFVSVNNFILFIVIIEFRYCGIYNIVLSFSDIFEKQVTSMVIDLLFKLKSNETLTNKKKG